MEIEELVKRIEWLDAERRKDKQLIIDLTNQIDELSTKLTAQKTQTKDLETAIKKVSQSLIKTSELEEVLSKQKIDFSEQLVIVEKKLTTFEKKYDKVRKDDSDSLTKKLIEFQTELKPLGEVRKSIQDRSEGEYRINQKVEENWKHLQSLVLAQEENKRLLALVDDSQKIDSKRIADLQIELNILRKKIEDERSSIDVQTERVKKVETRINDIENLEQLRKQEQVSFIETQSRSTVEFDKKWKEWESKFTLFEDLGLKIQKQLVDMDNTHRAVKGSLADFEEANLKLDRRINEITEINRLTEERFRQEWVSFKAEDQKRWTSYALTQEEQNRERDRDITQLTQLISSIEVKVQQLVDSVSIMNEETEKRIKGFLALSNELLTSYEKSIGKRT